MSARDRIIEDRLPGATALDASPIEQVKSRRRGLDPIALWTLYLLSLRQHLRGKRWMVMGAVFLLPAGLSILIRLTSPGVPPAVIEFAFIFMLIPQALLPLVSLVYASGMIQDEQEEQTITYLLIRPIPRWTLYLVKLLATLTTTITLVVVFTAASYLAITMRNETPLENVLQRCLIAMGVHSLSVMAYCCLFGLISLFTRRALVVGVLYSAIFEGLFGNIPLGIRLITVIYYARLIAYRSMSFEVAYPQGGTRDVAADAWQLDLIHDPQLLEHPSRMICVGVLIAASVAFSLVASFLCSGREFHVKTPEKG